jgi:5-aminopentanamidase
MKIAVLQGPQSSADPPTHLALLGECAARAQTLGARLLIAPEMFLTGYHIGAEAIRALAEPADGAAAQQVAQIARDTGVALLYGYAERDGEAIYNAAQLIDRDGRRLANHRKTHLFGDVDRHVFTAGAALTLAELDGLRLGVLICYELEFPENVRLLALAGADLIAVPTALMQPYRFVARTLVPARAFENQVFVAYANRCDTEREFDYIGLSCVIAPDGAELARAGKHEALLFADLEPRRQTESRRLNPYLHDRRPSLYGALADTPLTRGRPS